MEYLDDHLACQVQSAKDQLDALFNRREIDGKPSAFSESQVADIKILLGCIDDYKNWSRVPRTYILLRTIGQLDVLPDLVAGGFSDFFFPTTKRGLPTHLGTDCIEAILANQTIIYTQVSAIEHHDGSHWCIGPEYQPPLTRQGVLGEGGYARVYRVSSNINQKIYAAKSLHRAQALGYKRNAADTTKFELELDILKLVNHEHIVRFVGSYSEQDVFTLLIDPVADHNLDEYLSLVMRNPERKSVLRTYFGCLAGAVTYLHDYGQGSGIRHKDIKPKNILIRKEQVLLTDFGLSLHYKEGQETATSGRALGTGKYRAPEVASQSRRSWAAADIWSLGCVFVEMATVLIGKSLEDVWLFHEARGIGGREYHTSAEVLHLWLSELDRASSEDDRCCFDWARHMLQHDPEHRPKASKLLELVTGYANEEGEALHPFCGPCCLSTREPNPEQSLVTSNTSYQKGYLAPFPDMSDARYYAFKCGSPLDRNLKIQNAITRKLSTIDSRRSNLYVLRDKKTGLLRTKRTQDISLHLQVWKRDCKADFEIILEQANVPNASRMERLVLLELRPLWTRFPCPCKSIHRESFNTSVLEVLQLFQKWYLFVWQEPYDSDGNLKREWFVRLPRHVSEDSKQWNEFVNPPLCSLNS